MQTRFSFNAGELMPELAARADLDVVPRGCDVLENWMVSQTGTLRRRPGMERLGHALGDGKAMLFPYIYSYANADNVRYVVEVGADYVAVRSLDGQVLAEFRSGDGAPVFNFVYGGVRMKQINALMILTSLENPPLSLTYDGSVWKLALFEFKHSPWEKVHEAQDNALTAVLLTDAQGKEYFSVTGDEALANVGFGDMLRLSWWKDQQEIHQGGASVREGITIGGVPATAHKGEVFARATTAALKYYSCKGAWVAASYIKGLEDPSSYTDVFEVCEDITQTPSHTIWGLSDLGAAQLTIGTVIAQRQQEWEYWTCIKDFTKGDSNSFAAYPAHFKRGVPVGAVPVSSGARKGNVKSTALCRGAWQFYCGSLWYGEYEVMRNYKSPLWLDGNWESRGVSYSRISEAANTIIDGDEQEEECYMMLILKRSRRLAGTEDLAKGFIPDHCENRLIIRAYKTDLELSANIVNGEVRWVNTGLEAPWEGTRDVTDWSLGAFTSDNGYPLLCDIFNQRLVFAATRKQPQTIWMSVTDDINNFMTGGLETSAMALTMNTTSQNPICWLMARSKVLLLGTSEAEWVVSSGGSGNAISSSNAHIEDHSHVGSGDVAALPMEDKLLFVSRGSWHVHEFGYSFETDGYLARCLTELAGHIGREHGGILQCAMTKKPDTVAMFVLGDGQLALCTYNRLQEVKAWHRWTTDGQIISVCGMPNGLQADMVYLLVQRGEDMFLERVRLGNDFNDYGFEYESVMLTNSLDNFIEKIAAKENRVPLRLWLGEPLDNQREGTVLVSNNGKDGSWTIPTTRESFIPADWWTLMTLGNWQAVTKAGLRVRGQRECVLYALQL